jgi:hypothetical protein
MERFDEWLANALTCKLNSISSAERTALFQPVLNVSRTLSQSLQDFRNRLSDRAMGAPLRTSESPLEILEPRTLDVRVGKIFDRNWDLLSPVLPWWAIAPVVRKHLRRRAAQLVFTNFSRLAAQWDEVVKSAIVAQQDEAIRRLDHLVATIGALFEAAQEEAPLIRAELLRINELTIRLTG